MRMIFLLALASIVMSGVFSPLGEIAPGITVTVEQFPSGIHAYSDSPFVLKTSRGEVKAEYVSNAGFTGWVLTLKGAVAPFDLLGANNEPVFVSTVEGTNAIGWTWVSSNHLIWHDFPVDEKEFAAWLYRDKNLIFRCIPSGYADTRVLARNFVSESAQGKFRSLGLQLYLNSAYLNGACP